MAAAGKAAPGPPRAEDSGNNHGEEHREQETKAGSCRDDRAGRVDVAARVTTGSLVGVGREAGQRAANRERDEGVGGPNGRESREPEMSFRAGQRASRSTGTLRVVSEQRAYTGPMLVAGLLSLLVPGVGQLYRGATRRGLVLLVFWACVIVGGALFGSWISLDTFSGVDRSIVTAILAVDLALLAFRVFAVVDAARGRSPSSSRSSSRSPQRLTWRRRG